MQVFFCFKTKLAKNFYVAPHMHTILELVYCADGNATTKIGCKTYRMQGNQFTVIPAGIYHDQANLLETTTICIGICGSDLDDFHGAWTDTDGQLGNACRRLLSELEEKKKGYTMVCEGLLYEIAGLIERAAQDESDLVAKDQLVDRALYLIQHQEGKLSVGELASQLYVSKDYLRHLFLEYSSLSPLRHIILARIEKAKTLLSFPNTTINQIAAESGFESAYYFSRIFKKTTGYSPSQFRSRMTEKSKN